MSENRENATQEKVDQPDSSETEASKKATPKPPLIWIDLEMTGLDPDNCQILEIATIVTNGELVELCTGPDLVIHQPDSVLEEMNPWCIRHHGDSRLTQAIRESTISLERAEAETLEFLSAFTSPNASPLCGNSVGQDRLFIDRYMPKLSQFLHYRTIDVSSVKELVKRWYPTLAKFPKQGSHRALGDIRESIAELRFYRKHVFK